MGAPIDSNSSPLKSKSLRNLIAARMIKINRTSTAKSKPKTVIYLPKASIFQTKVAAIKAAYLIHYNLIQLAKKVKFKSI